jgi:hypothetical protein
MAITSLARSRVSNLVKYNSMLAGNPQFPDSYELISSTFLTGTAATVDFASIPSDYKHLQIRIVAKSSAPSSNDLIQMRFNDITSSDYAWHALRSVINSAPDSLSGASQTFINRVVLLTGGNDSNQFGSSIVDILDFSDTSKNTTVKIFSGTMSGSPIISLGSGLLNNTAAINKITLFPAANAIAALSRFSLYGIRAR